MIREPGSFRDPAGFVYSLDGVVLRQIDRSFAERWDDLVASGVLQALQERHLLVGHDLEALSSAADPGRAHAVIRPKPIGLITYPYEWSFGMLRDAALLTLDAHDVASEMGFTLRDATAYNVQYRNGRPILIDTLSFERGEALAPWVAYRQFCEHFLAPLALMAHRDIRLGLMLRDHLDGIPLNLASRLLPGRTRWTLGLGTHIHVHARAQSHFGGRGAEAASISRRTTVTPMRQRALRDSLRRTIESLNWDPVGTEWAEYENTTSYSEAATSSKDELVRRFLSATGGSIVWDIGANTGRYSRIAGELGREVVAWDIDHGATERHYRLIRREQIENVLPLVVDVANPSPGVGWAGRERRPFAERSNAHVVLALALLHHLAIGRNVPLRQIADYLAQLAPSLIVEFVPKEDPMARRLLATREDVFSEYTYEGFRTAFAERFSVLDEAPVEGTSRVLLYMARKP